MTDVVASITWRATPVVGASGRIRTCDTWYRKPVLYPLSYGGMRQRRDPEHYRATGPR
jgi:hypothetical protein